MLNNIKYNFSIKDLENLSGIKAHTIRIWEQRYHLLIPSRTETNIRYYDLDDLQKLLNVSLLNNNGYKISKLAKLTDQELLSKVKEVIAVKSVDHYAFNEFKLAMLKFDKDLFNSTFNKLLAEDSFENIFNNILIPFFDEVGLLWQSNYVAPANERFISTMIMQKLHLFIEKVQWTEKKNKEKTFVLFLPVNEIHELGLLFLHYKLLVDGYHSIYLGQSIPVDDLKQLTKLYEKINFISYFTVQPEDDNIIDYLKRIDKDILKKDHQLHILGRKLQNEPDLSFSTQIKPYKSISEFYVNGR